MRQACLLLLSALACLAGHLARAAEPAAEPAPSKKKGFGLPENKGMGLAQLEALKVGWYYNWGNKTALNTRAVFVPMVYSAKRAAPANNADYVLGFNEPDHPKQANMTVLEALEAWSTVTAKARYAVAPAMAGNPITGDWLPAFLKAKPKVDAIAVHWYKGADAKKFIADLKAIHEAYGKPLWVTEYCPQTSAASEQSPDRYAAAQVADFIAETSAWMEQTDWVQRYAWHHPKAGTCRLFDDEGKLTPVGKAYAKDRR
ncbi:hypothetical protein EBR16_08075 [bacterium]|nr:hypothetical protein [bacterium]